MANDDVLLVCGNPESLGDGTPSLQLPTNRVVTFIQDALPAHGKDEIWNWIWEAYKRWGMVCNFSGKRILDLTEATPSDIVHLVTVADLGGSGVLADQVLPYQGGRVLRMRINIRINWQTTDGPMPAGQIDPWRTLTHEVGHMLGMSHFPTAAPADLMEPFVSQTIIRPQAAEGKLAAGWFGPPLTVAPPIPPTPTPIPPGTGKSTIIIECDGTVTGARVTGVNS